MKDKEQSKAEMKTAKQFIIDNYGENWLRSDWTAGDVMDAMDDFSEQFKSQQSVITELNEANKIIAELREHIRNHIELDQK